MTSKSSWQPSKSTRAPAVVALGGGHGLATTLRTVRLYTHKITGVVSVADDGGSSGSLRAQYGIPAPGDMRRCISALATDEGLLASSLESRFEEGDLHGHPIGNLLLTGLTLAAKNFQEAVDELSKLVKTSGSLYPATVKPVKLIADYPGGVLNGQVEIEKCISDSVAISNLRFDRDNPSVADGVLQAIERADQVIIGPGSLFTSVLAAVIVPDILQAVNKSMAKRIFIANIRNASPSVQSDDVEYQVDLLKQYGVKIDSVVSPHPVSDRMYISGDIKADNGARHEPEKLAKILGSLY